MYELKLKWIDMELHTTRMFQNVLEKYKIFYYV